MDITVQRVRSAVFGAAIGDAVGVPYEFNSLEEMKKSPAEKMVGGGTYGLPAGTWSDDTSLLLCTLDKMDKKIDYKAIMKAFVSWRDEGEYTPYGECFDIGNTTAFALMNFKRFGNPLESGLDDDRSNGNGSLMRIIPAALYADAHRLSRGEAVDLSHTLSSLTHAHLRSKIGCGIFTCVALELIRFQGKSAVYDGLNVAAEIYSSRMFASEIKAYSRLLDDGFFALGEDKIQSSGYVVNTLECALWCLMNTESYRECILKAVNFGNDTDTAACVAGALAGLLYGLDGIPVRWREKLARADLIDGVIRGFCKRNGIR